MLPLIISLSRLEKKSSILHGGEYFKRLNARFSRVRVELDSTNLNIIDSPRFAKLPLKPQHSVCALSWCLVYSQKANTGHISNLDSNPCMLSPVIQLYYSLPILVASHTQLQCLNLKSWKLLLTRLSTTVSLIPSLDNPS